MTGAVTSLICILTNHNSFVDRDMFMRFRGGGVGHLYMRAIEIRLAETGWGSGDTLTSTNEDINSDEDNGNMESKGDSNSEEEDMEGKEDSESEEDNEDMEGKENSENDTGSSGDEISEDSDAAESEHSDSVQEHHSDGDSDTEYVSDEEEEETMDGKYGFSGF